MNIQAISGVSMNRVPRGASDPSTVVDGTIRDDGTRVAIGTDPSATSTFKVQGTTESTGDHIVGGSITTPVIVANPASGVVLKDGVGVAQISVTSSGTAIPNLAVSSNATAHSLGVDNLSSVQGQSAINLTSDLTANGHTIRASVVKANGIEPYNIGNQISFAGPSGITKMAVDDRGVSVPVLNDVSDIVPTLSGDGLGIKDTSGNTAIGIGADSVVVYDNLLAKYIKPRDSEGLYFMDESGNTPITIVGNAAQITKIKNLSELRSPSGGQLDFKDWQGTSWARLSQYGFMVDVLNAMTGAQIDINNPRLDGSVVVNGTIQMKGRFTRLLPFQNYGALGSAISTSPIIASTTTLDIDSNLIRWSIAAFVASNNNATNYWKFDLLRLDTQASVASISTIGATSGYWHRYDSGALSVSLPATILGLHLNITKVGTPGLLYIGAPAVYVE